MTSDLRETRLALPVYRPAKWLVRTLVCQPDRQDSNDSDMSPLAQYIEAAERDNTRRSYASAIRHFEIEWKGLLPSTADAIARYLADHAATLTINTLRQRLAALSRWHTDQGFADPTKSALVRQVLKGIRSVHTAPEKRARPPGTGGSPADRSMARCRHQQRPALRRPASLAAPHARPQPDAAGVLAGISLRRAGQPVR